MGWAIPLGLATIDIFTELNKIMGDFPRIQSVDRSECAVHLRVSHTIFSSHISHFKLSAHSEYVHTQILCDLRE